MKKYGIALAVIVIVAILYYIELSKVEPSVMNAIPALDNLEADEAAKEWGPFYRVRVTIIDGQSADFSIPSELKAKNGEELKLTGAVVFHGLGCREENGKIAVSSFFLLPSLGLAEACVIQPSIYMRWTILVNLAEDWVISRDDMIKAEAEVKGTFRIDTSKPYDAAFFLDSAVVELIQK